MSAIPIITAEVTEGGQPVALGPVRIWAKPDSSALGEMMLNHVVARTARGEGPDGAWPEYAPSTTERTGQDGTVTLRGTGALLDGLASAPTATAARVRSQIFYARFVANGTKRGMPSRNFLSFDEDLTDAVVDEAADRIVANAQGRLGATAGGILDSDVDSEPGIGAEVGTAL